MDEGGTLRGALEHGEAFFGFGPEKIQTLLKPIAQD